MNSLTIQDVLRGVETGRMQSVGLMQVIPLVSDLVDDRFVSPAEAKFRTTNYGSMEFENQSDNLLLVPCHVGYVVKQAAQDHAMAHAGLVKPKKSTTFKTAMCIQSGQGGYVREGQYEMLVLPYALRDKALNFRKKESYNKLWPDIDQFNRRYGVKGGSHLEFFLKQFAQELDEFVAQFECVPRQVGAIVLVDGAVVGVERAPNYAYWNSIWEALIRVCYGSLATEAARKSGQTSFHAPLEADRAVTKEDLRDLLVDARERDEASVRSYVGELIGSSFTVQEEDHIGGIRIRTAEHKQLSGQVVMDDETVVYASFVTKEKWGKNRAWNLAKAFSL